MTPREHAEFLWHVSDKECAPESLFLFEAERAIREAAKPLVEALRRMLWPDGVRPSDEVDDPCPEPCEVCSAKAALAAWEADA